MKRMKRISVFMIMVGLFSWVAAAQTITGKAADRPNFAGTWERVDSSSTLRNRTLVITQSEGEIVIEDSFEFAKEPYTNKITLYTDKRGESNRIWIPGGDAPIEIRSRTAWEKNKLVRSAQYESMIAILGRQSRQIIQEDQTYSLSEDGNTLTVRITPRRETPFAINPLFTTGKSLYRRKN
jgi:hypothetical protein